MEKQSIKREGIVELVAARAGQIVGKQVIDPEAMIVGNVRDLSINLREKEIMIIITSKTGAEAMISSGAISNVGDVILLNKTADYIFKPEAPPEAKPPEAPTPPPPVTPPEAPPPLEAPSPPPPVEAPPEVVEAPPPPPAPERQPGLCLQCGYLGAPDARFCIKCGAKL